MNKGKCYPINAPGQWKIEGNFVFEVQYNYLHGKTGIMKVNIALFAVIILMLSVFTRCSKGGGGTTYSMSATVGGTPYVAANCIARPLGTSLVIEGLGNSSTIPVALRFDSFGKTSMMPSDSVQLDSTQHNNFAQYFGSSSTYKISENGVVVINAINANEISGLFQFMCTDSTQVTGGSLLRRECNNYLLIVLCIFGI